MMDGENQTQERVWYQTCCTANPAPVPKPIGAADLTGVKV